MVPLQYLNPLGKHLGSLYSILDYGRPLTEDVLVFSREGAGALSVREFLCIW